MAVRPSPHDPFGVALRIRQYAYFAIGSGEITAVEMTRAIGLEPDEVSVRGSRHAIPGHRPVPYHHSWKVLSEVAEPQQRLGDQITSLIRRLDPYRAQIRQLIADVETAEPGSAGGVLQIVRYLDTADGELGDWQHRLLGWHLSAEVVDFLADVGAEVDVDEYGQSLPWWRFLRRRQYARVEEGSVVITETGLVIGDSAAPID